MPSGGTQALSVEVRVGVEPTYPVLQTGTWPLGYRTELIVGSHANHSSMRSQGVGGTH